MAAAPPRRAAGRARAGGRRRRRRRGGQRRGRSEGRADGPCPETAWRVEGCERAAPPYRRDDVLADGWTDRRTDGPTKPSCRVIDSSVVECENGCIPRRKCTRPADSRQSTTSQAGDWAVVPESVFRTGRERTLDPRRTAVATHHLQVVTVGGVEAKRQLILNRQTATVVRQQRQLHVATTLVDQVA